MLFFSVQQKAINERSIDMYSTRGLTARSETLAGTGLRVGVGGAAAAGSGLQLLHPVP